ncbi:hypothetical protein PU634_10355 [Oceanimonas pelagia]|uniref:Uncharacterized protein n=1 Tax=Oceanimonas pelagia TaxID=3028314 RepID=A0AA50QAT4_9GAMM|nr:hypothetical protein [Oceanimonas pelagia]WMC09517.1 hypothetical protein PU634_10355 [Oceanimonas pelagia]
MAKRITMTPELQALIARSAGDDVDVSQLAAYECVAASTRPISQKATAYHGAVMSEGLLQAAADWLTHETVPLITMHQGEMLPVGKVFHSEVVLAEQDHKELRTLFYLQESDPLTQKIDLGIIDEVSVGMMAEHAYCSECGFDYLKEGNEGAFWFHECDNGHVIGQNGTHLRLTGLRRWSELSLVGKGASNRPKIVGQNDRRLAAGINESYLELRASPSTNSQPASNQPKGKPDMDLKELVGELTETKVQLQLAQSGKETVEAQLSAANGRVEALQQEVEQLKAKLNPEQEAELSDLKAELEQAKSFIQEHAKLAATAAGLELKADAGLADQLEVLKAAQVKLAAIPRGGVARGQGEDVELKSAPSMAGFIRG